MRPSPSKSSCDPADASSHSHDRPPRGEHPRIAVGHHPLARRLALDQLSSALELGNLRLSARTRPLPHPQAHPHLCAAKPDSPHPSPLLPPVRLAQSVLFSTRRRAGLGRRHRRHPHHHRRADSEPYRDLGRPELRLSGRDERSSRRRAGQGRERVAGQRCVGFPSLLLAPASRNKM